MRPHPASRICDRTTNTPISKESGPIPSSGPLLWMQLPVSAQLVLSRYTIARIFEISTNPLGVYPLSLKAH